jgi:two-component sensor histidine kinase
MDWQKISSSIRTRRLLSVALGIVLFLLALGLRLLLPNLEGVPYVTFLPVVVVATLAGGLWAGVPCSVGGGVASWYLFVPPFNSFELVWPAGPVSLFLYALTVVLLIAVIEALHGAMEQQKAAQARTAALFQELQHRVANNMTLIAAILRLQRQKLADPACEAVLRQQASGLGGEEAARPQPPQLTAQDCPAFKALAAAEVRVETLARLHRRLYRPDTLDAPVGRMLRELCEDLLKASGRDTVACTVEAPEVSFELRRLLPIFFIVAEAVINAAKHAFAESEPGTIRVVLERAKEGFELTVSDDGHGLAGPAQLGAAGGPAGPARATDLAGQGGLGSQLVDAFARQLGGQVKTTFSGAGTTVRLTFPA